VSGDRVTGVVDGVPVVRSYGDVAREVAAIRTAVALSEQPHVAAVRVSGEDAYDFMDRVCPAPLYLRDGQLLHTLLLRPDGTPAADLYLGNDDGAFLLLGEGLPAAALLAELRAQIAPSSDVVLEDLSATHTVLSLNGPFAWELLAELEGPEVIGFPYLTFYRPAPDRIYFRAGKTGEYGYDLLVPRAEAEAIAREIATRGEPFDLACAGTDALWHCALENWFFNVHTLGRAGLTPLELQLSWRLSHEKDFVGAEALRARARAGITARVTGIVAAEPLAPGDVVRFGDRAIGRVLDASVSLTTGVPIAVALLELPYAHSGVDRYAVVRESAAPIALRTVSPPFVHNRSMFVNPQRHSYAERHEIRFPGSVR
jgi:aminomethyltransferase